MSGHSSMFNPRRLKALVFHWRSLITVALLALPFLVLGVLGLLWLWEHDGLVAFAIGCLLVTALIWALKYASARVDRRKQAVQGEPHPEIETNPEWSQGERLAFARACADIERATARPIPWNELPQQALLVVERVAAGLDGESRKPLDFSAPEALLLIEQTASRYRAHLRANLPYADQVSIAHLHWFWQRRKTLAQAWRMADGGRRILRMASNPAHGIIKEIEQLVSDNNTHYLSDQMLVTLQTLLLEEVASSAIDLYSGRLRFSAEELRQAELRSTRKDRERMADEEEPLRVLLLGQISSGKSSLLNHLIEQDRAETDWPQTTGTVRSYMFHFAGYPLHILDSPGIDGSPDNRALLLDEIIESDIVIWLHKADRPSRGADVELLQALQKWRDTHPQRRAPVLVHSLTFIDRLDPNWPFPEHHLSKPFEQRLQKALASVASQLSIAGSEPVMIAISNSQAGWNIGGLLNAIEGGLTEALMVQKQRKRIQEQRASKSLLKNASRGARGVASGTKKIGSRWLRKARSATKDTGGEP